MVDSDEQRQYRLFCKVVLLCFVWYTISSGSNVIIKIILNDFPYPMTVTMVQMLSVCTYLPPIIRLWNIPMPAEEISWSYYMKIIFPLAFGKFATSVSAHISILKVPVSYAHTVKATMPLFTVILARVIMKEKQTNIVYASLVPIITGVAIATVTELSFDAIGLICALLATMGFSMLNIFSKKCLKETSIHHLRLLLVLARLATVLFVPIWFLYDVRRIVVDEAVTHPDKYLKSIVLLVIDGACNFLQNIIAFTLLALITPLSYSVANATKRICIIMVSLVLMRNPVTSVNVFGMFLAVTGVLCYNKAKYDQGKVERRQQILPLVKSTPDLQQNHIYLGGLHNSNTEVTLDRLDRTVPTFTPSPAFQYKTQHMNGGPVSNYGGSNLETV